MAPCVSLPSLIYAGMANLLTPQDGVVASDPVQGAQLVNAGYTKCFTSNCDFYISPEVKETIQQSNGYYTCPRCRKTYDMLEDVPWHGAPEDVGNFTLGQGGGTRIGLSMMDQADIGEDLIHAHGLPGYGPIVWWHQGGACSKSPLDGATADWGIEVKTIGYDALHHRFIPGRPKEKASKNQQAAEMGLQGILGVLVLLDYRRSVADVYVKEMPLTPWQDVQGTFRQGVVAYRKNTGLQLLEEIPFQNPFMQPEHPVPQVAQPVTTGSPFAQEAPF